MLTRERILDCADELFSTYGVDHVSISMLSAHSQISRGAVYWHFADKAALVDALFARSYPILQAKGDAFLYALPTVPSFARLQEKCLEVVWDMISEVKLRCMFRILLGPCGRDDVVLVSRQFHRWLDDLREQIRELIPGIPQLAGELTMAPASAPKLTSVSPSTLPHYTPDRAFMIVAFLLGAIQLATADQFNGW